MVEMSRGQVRWRVSGSEPIDDDVEIVDESILGADEIDEEREMGGSGAGRGKLGGRRWMTGLMVAHDDRKDGWMDCCLQADGSIGDAPVGRGEADGVGVDVGEDGWEEGE